MKPHYAAKAVILLSKFESEAMVDEWSESKRQEGISFAPS